MSGWSWAAGSMRAMLLLVAAVLLTGWNGVARAQDELAAYVRVGAGMAWSRGTHFEDADCSATSPAAYFGCGSGADGRPFGAYGDFGRSGVFEGALGLDYGGWLRAEAVVGYRPFLAFSGQANFAGVPLGRQPVAADVTGLTAMVEGALSPGPLLGLEDLPVQPFFSAGVGVARNEIDRMVYRFPTLGAGSATITAAGESTELAWALGGGLDVPLTDDLVATIAYRYADLGSVRTDPGPIRVIRPAGVITIPVGETRARLRVDEVLVSLRARF
jgi:opacity protein-like surface antigen